MSDRDFIPYHAEFVAAEDSAKRAKSFYALMDKRRSLRHFSDKPVAKSIIEDIIKTASTAPSGAHKQPWTFCAISNLELKQKIKAAAEAEEFENYNGRMSEEWLRDLAPLETDWHKDFLEIAPWLIVVFRKSFDIVNGEKRKNYYVQESVGIAAGFLIAAIHNAGLASLTHTPSPMNFLAELLNRPENEKAFLLIPVGYPAKEAEVPNLKRKSINEIALFFE